MLETGSWPQFATLVTQICETSIQLVGHFFVSQTEAQSFLRQQNDEFQAVYKTRIQKCPSEINILEQRQKPTVSPMNQGCASSIYPTPVENFIDI